MGSIPKDRARCGARPTAGAPLEVTVKAMSKQPQPDLIEQVHRLDFAAAVRREQDQALRQRVSVQATPLWLLALIWIAIGVILFGSGVFVGWLAWHH
jgi:hypothetical protein